MTLLMKLRRYLGHEEPLLHPEYKADLQEAVRAVEDAKAAVVKSKIRKAEFRKITTSLAEMNNRNHYSESIYLAMLPKGKLK